LTLPPIMYRAGSGHYRKVYILTSGQLVVDLGHFVRLFSVLCTSGWHCRRNCQSQLEPKIYILNSTSCYKM